MIVKARAPNIKKTQYNHSQKDLEDDPTRIFSVFLRELCLSINRRHCTHCVVLDAFVPCMTLKFKPLICILVQTAL